MSIASQRLVSISSTDVVGDAIADDVVKVHAGPDEIPPHIGEALPDHQCAANPNLELCLPDTIVAIPTDLSPYIDAAAAMLLVYLIFFIGKLFAQSDDNKTRTDIKIALAVTTAGLLFTYLMT